MGMKFNVKNRLIFVYVFNLLSNLPFMSPFYVMTDS